MKQLLLLALLGLLTISSGQKKDNFIFGTFPDDFKWGFATASYQIEGAWNESGKGENIWDEFTHRDPSPIFDQSTGDVACDSYNKYEEDVELLKSMGAQYYRFSISWSRILPTGKDDVINQDGIDYYNRLIDLLIQNNIEPMITLYHWDLPQPLQDIGGWPNERLAEYFLSYADIAYREYGNRVKNWITFNEPWVICFNGYGNAEKAPGIEDAVQTYQCAHTIIKAHAKAYRLYDSTYRPSQQGRIGITLDSGWYEPKDPSNPEHVEAAERTIQFRHGWFGSPVIFGKYPDVMREYIDRASQEQNLTVSRLPHFTRLESSEIKGTLDFLGLNHYTTELVEPRPDIPNQGGWYHDQRTLTTQDPSWPDSSASWLKVVPWGFRKLLNWLKKTYGSPLIYVTENGYADYPDTGLNDTARVDYYNQYINQMLLAVNTDKVKVKAYTAWSLMDNFEWARGYSERFGIHYVDFEDPIRPRSPKASATLLKQIIADNGFPDPKLKLRTDL